VKYVLKLTSTEVQALDFGLDFADADLEMMPLSEKRERFGGLTKANAYFRARQKVCHAAVVARRQS
jgi:hypothetical protein